MKRTLIILLLVFPALYYINSAAGRRSLSHGAWTSPERLSAPFNSHTVHARGPACHRYAKPKKQIISSSFSRRPKFSQQSSWKCRRNSAECTPTNKVERTGLRSSSETKLFPVAKSPHLPLPAFNPAGPYHAINQYESSHYYMTSICIISCAPSEPIRKTRGHYVKWSRPWCENSCFAIQHGRGRYRRTMRSAGERLIWYRCNGRWPIRRTELTNGMR